MHFIFKHCKHLFEMRWVDKKHYENVYTVQKFKTKRIKSEHCKKALEMRWVDSMHSEKYIHCKN